MFTMMVERTIAAAHSNGPAGQKCHTMHGHDWRIEVMIEYEYLDEWGWGPDFGSIKSLVDTYDHETLNDMMSEPPSAENLALQLYREIEEYLRMQHAPKQAHVTSLTVEEGASNIVIYTP